ncbi:MAG: ATP-binding protein [Bacilli bacterium]|nr:ATP-binding protein [Bacilli bacterium]
MKIILNNFAKIKKAEINVDGITVIAGKNNSGKSTIGKAIFSFFYAFKNLKKEIFKIKREFFMNSLQEFFYYGNDRDLNLQKHAHYYFPPSSKEHRFLREIKLSLHNNLFDDNFNADRVKDILETYNKYFKDYNVNFEDCLERAISSLKQVDDFQITKSVIEDKFNNVFDGQLCNFNNKEDADLSFEIKNGIFSIDFVKNKVKNFVQPFAIEHDAFLIDNPLILNKLSNKYGLFTSDENYAVESIISSINMSFTTKKKTSISSIVAKEKMDQLIDSLDKVVGGEAINTDEGIMLMENKNGSPTSFKNVSSGLKAFVLLKLLIESEIIKDNDFLILDEPEVHLHPEWQIEYARIIVMLQKLFNLNIVITTHSRDFLEAIELYSKKYNISNKCNFYISVENDNEISFKNLSDNPDELYRQLITPAKVLDKLRFELEDND